MSALKYKSGDKVRIKDIDWYNKNKDSNGNVVVLSKVPHFSWYENVRTVFTKDMAKFCGKVVTIESVWSVNYSIVEGTYRDGINIDYFTDEMIEGLVEEETKPKFKVGDRVITDTNMKGKIIEVVEEGWYRVDFDDYNGISQPNGVVPEESMSLVEEGTKPEFDYVMAMNDLTGLDIERSCILHEYDEYKKAVDEHGYYSEEALTRKFFINLHKMGISQNVLENFGFNLPEGYIVKDENGNEILTSKIILEKKKKDYPKTYEECAEIIAEHTGSDCNPKGCMGYMSVQLTVLQKLFICRDAYWKLYGEEMGLGKPWEPDWTNISDKYCIYFVSGELWSKECQTRQCPFAFPTPEMRDAFRKNFGPDIEKCKELL